jgi:hypothetical protein
MQHLWQVLLHASETGADPLSCEDCFVLMDYLSDLLAGGYSPRTVLPLAEKYLEHCPNCHDEFIQDMEELLLVPIQDPDQTPD